MVCIVCIVYSTWGNWLYLQLYNSHVPLLCLEQKAAHIRILRINTGHEPAAIFTKGIIMLNITPPIFRGQLNKSLSCLDDTDKSRKVWFMNHWRNACWTAIYLLELQNFRNIQSLKLSMGILFVPVVTCLRCQSIMDWFRRGLRTFIWSCRVANSLTACAAFHTSLK